MRMRVLALRAGHATKRRYGMKEGPRPDARPPQNVFEWTECGPRSNIRRESRIHRRNRYENSMLVSSRLAFSPKDTYRDATGPFLCVAEEKQAADDVWQAANELHQLYRNARFGYHSLDAAGVVMDINDVELEWLGYARDEVVGKMRITDLMLPQRLDWFEEKFAQLKERDSLHDLEYEMLRKDGTTFLVLVNVAAIKDINGQFLRSHASVFNVSDRKRAESELSESEMRNAAILHAALDCVVSIDRQGKIIEFNPAAERTFGYAREEVIGQDVAEIIIPPAVRGAHRRGMQRYLTTGESSLLGKRVQVTAMRRDGSEFPAELTITHVRSRQQSIFCAWLRDITRDKWIQEELRRHANELRAVSRRLVEVQETERRELANALHDLIGQKLTALNINLNIVKSQSVATALSQVDARLEDSLKLVDETIESIRDVMAALRPAVLDDYGLSAGLRWYATQFSERTAVSAKVIEQGLGRRLPGSVEKALFRIAQEALANVAKYACVSEVTLELVITADASRLTIVDDGCGFDPLACQQPAKDHGWGLIIMRERAAAVGAELSVQSAPGHGTRVVVTMKDHAP
jgi:PAS domain S-box-containing protein